MYANPALDVRQLCPALALGAFSPSSYTRPGNRKSSDARLVPSMTPLYVALAECTSPPPPPPQAAAHAAAAAAATSAASAS